MMLCTVGRLSSSQRLIYTKIKLLCVCMYVQYSPLIMDNSEQQIC